MWADAAADAGDDDDDDSAVLLSVDVTQPLITAAHTSQLMLVNSSSS